MSGWAEGLAPAHSSAQPIVRSASAPHGMFERARAYVGKMPPAISGSGGHNATWNVARKCAADFGLSADQTLDILREYNARCEPPWSDRELAHKAKSASEKARIANPVEDRERHWAMPAEHYDDVPPSEDDYEPEPPPGMFDDEPADTEPDEQPTAEDPLRGLKHLAAVALVGRRRILELASKPVSYVWQDIAAPGTICLLAGKSGDGKTTLLFLVLGARANLEAPIALLGREIRPAPPGQFVVLIEGEHSEASAARKLVQSLRLLGVDDIALDRVIIIARKAVRLGSPEWADVVSLVAAGLVSDIAIDTVARVAPGDADSEREQVAIFEGVAQAIERAPDGVTPPSVWPVAHLRKGNGSGGLDEVSGSAQRVGQADSVLMLAAERVDGRVVSSRVTFAKLRDDPDEWPEPAEIIIARGADGVRTLTSGAVADAPTDDRPLEARVLELLALGPKTKNGLAEALKRSKQDVDAAITNLFSAKRIATTTVKVRGQARKAFELRRIPDSIPDLRSHGTDTGPIPDDSE